MDLRSFVLFFLLANISYGQFDTIIDSNFKIDDVFKGKKIPDEIINQQVLIDIYYYGYDEKIHKGQLVCHFSVEDDILKVEEIKFTNGKLNIFAGSDNAAIKGTTLAILKTSAKLLIKINIK